MFARGYSGIRVPAFFEKLAHFLAFVAVVTTEAPQSKKLIIREWNGTFYVFADERMNVAIDHEKDPLKSLTTLHASP